MDSKPITPIAEAAAATAQDQVANYASDFTAVLSAGQALIDSGQAINAEMLAFWQSRFKHGLATGQRLLECGSLQGALEIQLDYAKAGLQAYVDQSTKVAGLLTDAWTDSLMPKGSAQPSTGAKHAAAA